MITVAGRVLMTSMLQRSEVAVAVQGCRPIRQRARPRVLLGGLGLGFTLRAALDELPGSARVVVAELHARVVDWCRGPAAAASGHALSDPRVEVVIGDVAAGIHAVAGDPARPRFDAVILDLYEGPADADRPAAHPLYGRPILERTHQALGPGGVYAVWGEDRSTAFEKRLRAVGFDVRLVRAHGGGPRHAVYVARKQPANAS